MSRFYTLFTFLILQNAALATMESPLKRSCTDFQDPGKVIASVETQKSFIQSFYEGQRILSKENLTHLGFSQNIKDIIKKAYSDDVYAFFILHLCKEKFIDPKDFLQQHRSLFIQINKRAVAANSQNPMAAYNLGLAYLYGICLEQSTHDGIEYLTIAATRKHLQAQLFLSDLYQKGQLVPANPQLSKQWNDVALQTLTENFSADGTGW